MRILALLKYLPLAVAATLPALAHGQEASPDGAPAAAQADDAAAGGASRLELETVVITATANPLTRIRSSASGSVLYPEDIRQSAPSNAADILRNVPGIVSQASGGEGNANVSARGLPQSGGAKLMQFQEDGLPVLEFGDINFSTADTFVRADNNLDRLEVIRGGSAATFASNAPGGVINFISKTGEVPGGSVGLSRGLDFDQTRVDFDYGKPLSEAWRFHVGGFYRNGEGPRTVGYTAESGGQLKGNLTHDFGNGYVRLNFKVLEDHAPVYLPVPIKITGSNTNPHVDSLPGFDVRHGAMQSRHFRHDLAVDGDGKPVSTDIADGYHSSSQAFGGEAAFRLAEDWKVENKFRIAATSGGFVGPYPAQVAAAATLATDIGGPGATLRYASGPRAGQAVADPASLNGNGLAVRTHLFNTSLEDMGNFANDFKLTKTFDSASYGRTGVTLGYYKSRQNIVQDWHWNTYLQEVKGEGAALLDVVDAQGNLVTQNGLVAYGEPFWGNCCVRVLDVRYKTDAPYLSVNWEQGPYNIDGSLRYDIARAFGRYAGASGTTALDVNGNGVIEVPERTVPIVDRSAAAPVDYSHHYLSYSFGLNYLLRRDLAAFARVSEGGRANADRLLFGGGVRPDGSVDARVAINKVRQIEGGLKWQGEHARLFATLFRAETNTTDQNVTSVTNRFTDREFEAHGVELEGAWYRGGFSASGGITYTDGKVTRDEINPANEGQTISPRFVYQLTLAYDRSRFGGGVNFIGSSDYRLGDGLVLPAFTQVNAFLSYELAKGVSLAVQGHNLFDTIGLTEAPNGPAGVTPDGLNTARSIIGRTILAALRYAL
jgi:outer membrane receptor protein involved in Fe transport